MLELPLEDPSISPPLGQDGPMVSPLPDGDGKPRRGVVVLDL